MLVYKTSIIIIIIIIVLEFFYSTMWGFQPNLRLSTFPCFHHPFL